MKIKQMEKTKRKDLGRTGARRGRVIREMNHVADLLANLGHTLDLGVTRFQDLSVHLRIGLPRGV